MMTVDQGSDWVSKTFQLESGITVSQNHAALTRKNYGSVLPPYGCLLRCATDGRAITTAPRHQSFALCLWKTTSSFSEFLLLVRQHGLAQGLQTTAREVISSGRKDIFINIFTKNLLIW